MAEHTDVIVIGGSQAGLVAGYHLKRAGIRFLILDAGYQVGQAWRSRWDSLTLFTTARYSTLPGLDFPGHPEHFPNKDEMADYLAGYADTFQLPIRLDTKVTALTAADGGYRADTDSGVYHAAAVIVATGAYQQPHLPAISEKLAPDVFQVHSARYRNPRQIPDREVLVVGAANSGAGIAEDLAATHRVTLSQGSRIPHLPRRLVGKSLHFWGGSQLDVDAVVWATGYRADYSWIQLPVLDPTGAPIHRRGITDHPGLYFLGMKHQHSRGSALIHWVTHDAAYLVDDIRTQRASNRA
jgi:putative flavoprotein involved in K+ transport